MSSSKSKGKQPCFQNKISRKHRTSKIERGEASGTREETITLFFFPPFHSIHNFLPYTKKAYLLDTGSICGLYTTPRTTRSCCSGNQTTKIHRYGHWDRPHNTVQAWVIISMPHKTTLTGIAAATLDEAEESAAQTALDHLCTNCNLVINDYNLQALCATKTSLQSAQEHNRTKQHQFNMARQQVTF